MAEEVLRAVRITRFGGPEVLELGTLSVPDPGPGEVRVRVLASGVNRADLIQRRGRYPAPPGWPADVPGLEYAGTVEAVGPEVRGLGVGARVMGIAGGGGYAEARVGPAPSRSGPAWVPTPRPGAGTRSAPPAVRPICPKSASQAVMKTSGIAPASTGSIPSGMRTTSRSRTTSASA